MEHTQTSFAITILNDLFRHAARACEELATEHDFPIDAGDPYGHEAAGRALIAAAEAAAVAAVTLNDLSDGSRRERAKLLQRVRDRSWPGLKTILRDEATLWAEARDGFAISLEDGNPFWVSQGDLLDAARDYLAGRILEAEGWRRYPWNHSDKPTVSDVQARDWVYNGRHPAGVEL